jgi:hypothetical protein
MTVGAEIIATEMGVSGIVCQRHADPKRARRQKGRRSECRRPGGWSRLYGKDAHGNSPDSPREGARLEPSVSRPVRVSERATRPTPATTKPAARCSSKTSAFLLARGIPVVVNRTVEKFSDDRERWVGTVLRFDVNLGTGVAPRCSRFSAGGP